MMRASPSPAVTWGSFVGASSQQLLSQSSAIVPTGASADAAFSGTRQNRPRRGMREIAALDSALLANNRSGFRRVVFALQLYAITRIVNHLRPCLRSCDGGYTLRLTSLS